MRKLNILKPFVVAAIIMTSVFACKTNNVEFTTVSVADSSRNHSNDTAIYNFISIKYVDAKSTDSKSSIANNINKDFFAWLNGFFYNDTESLTKDNLKEAVASEIKKFIKDINEDATLAGCQTCKNAELIVSVDSVYQNDKIVSVVYSFYQYSGGAHGNHGVIAFNYQKNGAPITAENLSTNIDELTAIAKQTFIEQNGELKNYWFDNENFHLPDVFYFTENATVFYYAPSEIAPYSDGDIYIEISNDKVKHLIDYIN
ncbi:MAG: DUF3298 and DUF4163 domain-containing protein [Prevotellaceae bacterium]|jgi:hypothetical protein|nr:DUF3298 and DUF4163 domain-containing protein [Prevotellaceae bacterium]